MNKTEARRRKKSKKRKQQVQKRQQEKCKNKPDMVSQTIKSNTTLLQQAIAHHQAGRLQQAEHIYQHIIEVEPENATAYHLLGVIAHQAGKNDIAVQLISKSIAKDSNQPFFYNNLGNVLKEQGKLDRKSVV